MEEGNHMGAGEDGGVRGEGASGYVRMAAYFMRARDSSVGPDVVRAWAERLPRGARVLDVGCGHGVPITATLLDAGFEVSGVDGSAPLVAAFRERFPDVSVECSDVDASRLLDATYDGVVAWGLVFLLPPEAQHRLLARLAAATRVGGHLLVTAPRQVLTWNDALTDLPSWSLGEAAYRDILSRHGIDDDGTAEDSGGNVYLFGRRR